MAQPPISSPVACLRTITLRLSSTPTKQLPHIASYIAGSLWNCKDILSPPSSSAAMDKDAAAIVHRFMTTLSSLLQDRSVEGRWTALILVKATVEVGGAEVLRKSGGWVRNLLGIVKKPDPPSMRCLAVITLTRIFMLTWDYTNLVREITTPALPTFISSCLSNINKSRSSASELQNVLEAFAMLIPRHPTIFRTNEAQIRSILTDILSVTSSDDVSKFYTQQQQIAARNLLALLHHSTPKQGAAEKWDETLKVVITAAHTTCDRLFRSVIENRISAPDIQPSRQSTMTAPEFGGEDAMGLGGWESIFVDSRRLINLLDLIKSHLETVTAGSVSVRVGLIVDLLTRLFGIYFPTHSEIQSLQINKEIPRDEREAMFGVIPTIHVSAMKVLQTVLHRFGSTVASILQNMVELLVTVFRLESSDVGVRTSTYQVMKAILELIGPSMLKEDVAELFAVMRACCDDSLCTKQDASHRKTTKANEPLRSQPQNEELPVQPLREQQNQPTSLQDLSDAASTLLPTLLLELNSAHIPPNLRTQMDRTAILTGNKAALVASVLNPARNGSNSQLQTSILPFLVREFPDATEVEALLRPRMPPPFIQLGQKDNIGIGRYEEEEDEEDAKSIALNGAIDQDNGLALTEHEDAHGSASSLNPRHDDFSGSPTRWNSHSPTPRISPPRQLSRHDHINSKREASSSAEAEQRSEKKQRVSPVATTLLSQDHVSERSDPTSKQSGLPITVPLDSNITAATQQSFEPQLAPIPPSYHKAQENLDAGADGGSDESDFEMPPLTMEPDTDPEDESYDMEENQ